MNENGMTTIAEAEERSGMTLAEARRFIEAYDYVTIRDPYIEIDGEDVSSEVRSARVVLRPRERIDVRFRKRCDQRWRGPVQIEIRALRQPRAELNPAFVFASARVCIRGARSNVVSFRPARP